MSLVEILADGGGILILLLTLIQVSPIKLNPWSAIGKVFNGSVIEKLDSMERRLDAHINADDERNADSHRKYILQFNTSLLRGARHTEEEFNEALYNIDCYERYCSDHPEYQNNRAVHAIKNIVRVYDDRLEKRDFLQ